MCTNMVYKRISLESNFQKLYFSEGILFVQVNSSTLIPKRRTIRLYRLEFEFSKHIFSHTGSTINYQLSTIKYLTINYQAIDYQLSNSDDD